MYLKIQPIISQQLDTTLFTDIQQTFYIPLASENQSYFTEQGIINFFLSFVYFKY